MSIPSGDPEFLRLAVNRIKQLATTREPAYEQPADSHIEDAVKEILYLSDKQWVTRWKQQESVWIQTIERNNTTIEYIMSMLEKLKKEAEQQ